MAVRTKRNPLKTRNDRPRLLIMGKAQLEEAITKSTRPRIKDKLQRRLTNLIKRGK
jgi:hypothetical protein